MWSHYANSHRGYCLEFSINIAENFFSGAEYIFYTNKYPVVKLYESEEVDLRKITTGVKSEDWCYECEWRLGISEPGLMGFPPEVLTGLIFGCKMKDKDKDQIKKWVGDREHKLNLQKAEMHPDQFKIIISDL